MSFIQERKWACAGVETLYSYLGAKRDKDPPALPPKNYFYRLLGWSPCLAQLGFVCHPGSPAQGWYCPQQSLIKKIPHRLAYRPI